MTSRREFIVQFSLGSAALAAAQQAGAQAPMLAETDAQGKATDAAAACPLFTGKQVAGKGWCSAWAKKPDPMTCLKV